MSLRYNSPRIACSGDIVRIRFDGPEPLGLAGNCQEFPEKKSRSTSMFSPEGSSESPGSSASKRPRVLRASACTAFS